MALREEMSQGVDRFFAGNYSISAGTTPPTLAEVPFGKVGRELEMATLYIDVHSSTNVVDGFRRQTAAKMYKALLWGVAKIAGWNQGEILSFNSHGVLVGFVGDDRATSAVATALYVVHYGNHILRPKFQNLFAEHRQIADTNFNFGIGVDVGTLLVVRAGLKRDNHNDLVWAGNAMSQAAKLANEAALPYNIGITWDTYVAMDAFLYRGGVRLQDMWELNWSTKLQSFSYRSNWYRKIPSDDPDPAPFPSLG